MSSFIVPIGSLPSISSLSEIKAQQNVGQAAGNNLAFADVLQQAVENLGGATQESQDTMANLALGGSDDLHTAAIATVKATTAVNYTSGLVSAAIRAYNDLIKMQI